MQGVPLVEVYSGNRCCVVARLSYEQQFRPQYVVCLKVSLAGPHARLLAASYSCYEPYVEEPNLGPPACEASPSGSAAQELIDLHLGDHVQASPDCPFKDGVAIYRTTRRVNEKVLRSSHTGFLHLEGSPTLCHSVPRYPSRYARPSYWPALPSPESGQSSVRSISETWYRYTPASFSITKCDPSMYCVRRTGLPVHQFFRQVWHSGPRFLRVICSHPLAQRAP